MYITYVYYIHIYLYIYVYFDIYLSIRRNISTNIIVYVFYFSCDLNSFWLNIYMLVALQITNLCYKFLKFCLFFYWIEQIKQLNFWKNRAKSVSFLASALWHSCAQENQLLQRPLLFTPDAFSAFCLAIPVWGDASLFLFLNPLSLCWLISLILTFKNC